MMVEDEKKLLQRLNFQQFLKGEEAASDGEESPNEFE
jgi:hypothetical protein